MNLFKHIIGYVAGAGLIALSVIVPATAPVAAPLGAGMLGLSNPEAVKAFAAKVLGKK